MDNILESAAARAAAALGLPLGGLHGLHRLDAGTSGVVVLGRGGARGLARWFGAAVADKGGGGSGGGEGGGKGGATRARKVYLAATLARPPLGRLVHFATVGARGPGEPAHTRVVAAGGGGGAGEEEGAGGVYCELEVLRVRRRAAALGGGRPRIAGRSNALDALSACTRAREHGAQQQARAARRPRSRARASRPPAPRPRAARPRRGSARCAS